MIVGQIMHLLGAFQRTMGTGVRDLWESVRERHIRVHHITNPRAAADRGQTLRRTRQTGSYGGGRGGAYAYK